MNLWRRFKNSTITNQAMVVLTGVIAVLTAVNIGLYVQQSSDQSEQVAAIETAITDGITTAKDAIDSSLTQNRKEMENVFLENRNALSASLETIHATSQEALRASIEQGQGALDATIAASQLDQRPWLKVSHRILKPLTFNVGGRASGKDVAMLELEKTIENVGKSVAIGILSWEDAIPLDLDWSPRSALARREQWCGDNRFPKREGRVTGYTLFPGDKMILTSSMGPTMERVKDQSIRTVG